MLLMYVDESGDTGLLGSPVRYFVLSGIVLHELAWQPALERLIAFRRRMREEFGLKLREEIHAARFINNPGDLVRIPRHHRLQIIREFADELAANPALNIINVVVDKSTKGLDYGVFENAWRTLLQRLENTIAYRNFSGPLNTDERAMVFPDNTDAKRLKDLLRKMRAYNPIPNAGGAGYRDRPLTKLIEDPAFKDSEHSYFIQAADLAAFLLYQELAPNGYMRKKGGHRYFSRLEPVLCRAATLRDPRGIVRL